MDCLDDVIEGLDPFYDCITDLIYRLSHHYCRSRQELNATSDSFDRLPTFGELREEKQQALQLAEAGYSADFSFTITLPRFMHTLKPLTQYLKTYDLIVRELKDHKLTLVYEFTQNYNIHYHGIVSFNKALLKDKIPGYYWANLWRKYKQLGFNSIKQIDNFEGWSGYIREDFNIMKQAFPNINPIIINQHNIPNEVFIKPSVNELNHN